MAPNAALRPFQILALSSALPLRRIIVGLKSLGNLADLLQQRIDLVLGALHLDDQQRLDVERIAGGDEMLADMDRGPVHEFERHGNDAGADDGGDAGAGRLVRTRSRSASGARPLPP